MTEKAPRLDDPEAASPSPPPHPAARRFLGEVVQLADNLWFIHGEMPKDASKEPDWCNVVIYRSADGLYLIDSGGGSAIRSSIQRILSEVGEVESFTLINSHGHLDHICNNDVISSVRAGRKRHLLRKEAIEFVKSDFSAYMADQFDYLDTFFDPFSGYQKNRLLYRVAGLLRDGLGSFAGRKRVLQWLFRIQFNKFKPMNDSRATMEPLQALPSRQLRFDDVCWNGWSLGEDDLYVFEGAGHTAGDVLVYIPEHRLLCLGDVTFPLFPTFPDGDRERILECLHKSLAMVRNGCVRLLADGHGDRCYRGRAEVEGVLNLVIGDHQEYVQILREIFESADGLTPAEAYRAFKAFSDRPVVSRYLALEFPHSPPSLQNVMVTTLLQLGFDARGPRRHKRFYRPEDGRAFRRAVAPERATPVTQNERVTPP